MYNIGIILQKLVSALNLNNISAHEIIYLKLSELTASNLTPSIKNDLFTKSQIKLDYYFSSHNFSKKLGLESDNFSLRYRAKLDKSHTYIEPKLVLKQKTNLRNISLGKNQKMASIVDEEIIVVEFGKEPIRKKEIQFGRMSNIPYISELSKTFGDFEEIKFKLDQPAYLTKGNKISGTCPATEYQHHKTPNRFYLSDINAPIILGNSCRNKFKINLRKENPSDNHINFDLEVPFGVRANLRKLGKRVYRSLNK